MIKLQHFEALALEVEHRVLVWKFFGNVDCWPPTLDSQERKFDRFALNYYVFQDDRQLLNGRTMEK